MPNELTTAYVSSYPPRACGIATFTRDLSEAVAGSEQGSQTRIAAINDEGSAYAYPPVVRWEIDQYDPLSWRDTARAINKSRVGMVSIQHEFGITGRFERDGRFTDHMRGFLDALKKPVVATLHTVLPHPREEFRETIRAIHDRSEALVTMVNVARLILEQEYGLNPAKLHTIPHGVPVVRKANQERLKASMRLEGRTVLCTFGLLSSGKGIQYVIRALPDVVKHHPEVLYLVVGETHPEVRKHEGEKYRNSLIELIKKLGLEKQVRFVNQYLSTPQLMRYLQATDIYVTPYIERNQITSGTLAYALGVGRPCISTPYLYAQEALAENRGIMAEFQNPKSFARCINLLLENPELRELCSQNALAYGKAMTWPKVGARYAELYRRVAGVTAPPSASQSDAPSVGALDGVLTAAASIPA